MKHDDNVAILQSHSILTHLKPFYFTYFLSYNFTFIFDVRHEVLAFQQGI